MIHPHTELRFIDERIGMGVFATRDIPRGTITWALDELDRLIDPDHARKLGALYGAALAHYAYRNGEGQLVLCWDIARYENHSCDATTLSAGWDFDIALRDIAAGEEITTDYGSLNVDEPFDCGCAKSSCRRLLTSDDFARLAPVWDARIAAAFPDVGRVDQPLWPLIGRDAQAVEDTLAGKLPPPSIRRHRCESAAASPSIRAAARS